MIAEIELRTVGATARQAVGLEGDVGGLQPHQLSKNIPNHAHVPGFFLWDGDSLLKYSLEQVLRDSPVQLYMQMYMCTCLHTR